MSTGRWRLLAGGLGASLFLAAGATFLPSSAGADDAPPVSRSLVATASAEGMRMGYSVPDQFAVSQFIDGGGPVAQVNVDSTGRAVGFGSLPYPGENAVAAPGVLTLATKAPFPPYPFYAEASYPVTPGAEVKDPSGTYDLSAKAEQQKAEGLAAVSFGGAEKPVARVVSSAAGSIDASGARVTATSIGEGFSFGDGMLKIASGTSRSVTTYTAGAAKPETKSELLIQGAKVGDQAVTIGPDGVHPFGGNFAFPGGADQLNQSLRGAGITVRTLSLQMGDSGASTEVLQVTVKHPIPGATVQGTFVYEFGGSISSIALGSAGSALPALPPAGDTGPPGDVTPPAPSAAEAPPPPSSPSSALPSSSDLVSSEPVSTASSSARLPAGAAGYAPAPSSPAVTGTGPEVPSGETALAPTTPAAPVAVDSEPVALARADLKKPGRVLMAVLAAAGAILLAASTLWRKAL